MEAVRPPTPRKNATRELIDDINVVVLHDIVNVFLVKRVRTEKLIYHMDTVGLHHK